MIWKKFLHLLFVNRCAMMVVFLVLFSIGYTLAAVEDDRLAYHTLSLIFLLVMAAAPYLIAPRLRILLISLTGGVFLLVFWALQAFGVVAAGGGGETALQAALILFETALTIYAVSRTFRTRYGEELIASCVLTYLLIGIVFGNVFFLLSRMQGGSFRDVNGILENPGFPDLLYFSFSTLTTAGYGDIVPVLAPARLAATLEQVAGVLYVALFIGHTLSVYGMGQQKKEEH